MMNRFVRGPVILRVPFEDRQPTVEGEHHRRKWALVRLPVYALFLFFPFLSTTVFGEVALLELPLYACVFLILGQLKNIKIRLHICDIYVLIYCIASLVAVINGMEILHDSARNYRWAVLMPGAIYAVVRFCPLSLYELRTGIFLMLPGITLQGAELIRRYIKAGGGRAPGREGIISIVTLTLLFVFGISALLYLRYGRSSKRTRIISWAVMGTLLFSLGISFQRVPIIGFVILLIIVPWIWAKRVRMTIFGVCILLSFMAIMYIIVTDVALPKIPIPHDVRVRQGTFERIYAWDLYLLSSENRINLWRTAVAQPLKESPFLGLGMNVLSVDWEEGAVMDYGSPHNMMVTAIRQGGLLSLTALLVMLYATYSALNGIHRSFALSNEMGKFLFLNFVLVLIVALTNDLSAGRAPFLFLLMALVVRTSLASKGIRE